MDFLKKHKKWVIVAAVLIILVVLIAWYIRSKQTNTETEESEVWGVGSTGSTGATELNLIKSKMDEIKNDPAKYEPVKYYDKNRFTINQSLAVHAIRALKLEGKLTMNFGGSGEWGHEEYAIKNF